MKSCQALRVGVGFQLFIIGASFLVGSASKASPPSECYFHSLPQTPSGFQCTGNQGTVYTKLENGDWLTSTGSRWEHPTTELFEYEQAIQYCRQRDGHLPTVAEIRELNKDLADPTSNRPTPLFYFVSSYSARKSNKVWIGTLFSSAMAYLWFLDKGTTHYRYFFDSPFHVICFKPKG